VKDFKNTILGSRVRAGRYGERLVEKRFLFHGHTLLDRRFRLARVEWDLCFWKDGVLLLVEVRSRRLAGVSHEGFHVRFPERKRRRLEGSVWAVDQWMKKHFPFVSYTRVRVDWVEVTIRRMGVRIRVHEKVDGNWRTFNH
jgi:Holliday junction resolvase-like predicted endonuclease